MEPHTKTKHDILSEYLKAWFPILSSTAEQIVFIDGFAGPGIYSKGEKGSPIIALETAIEHSSLNNFKKITFLFIEKNKDRAEMLEKILKERFTELPDNIKYNIEKSEFASSVETILDELENEGSKLAPTLAFIDPFGFSGLPMSLITRILGYKRCEVLITFMDSYINRFHDKKQESVLDTLFGTPDWRGIQDISAPVEKKQFIIDLYIKQLRKLEGIKFSKVFEMIGKNNQTIYHLIFATKNLMGLKAMKEAMLKVNRQGTFIFSDRTDPHQTSLFNYNDDNLIPIAANAIFEKFAGKTLSVEKIEEFVLVDTPFVFRKNSLKNLEKSNKIRAVEGRKRKGAFPAGCTIQFSNQIPGKS